MGCVNSSSAASYIGKAVRGSVDGGRDEARGHTAHGAHSAPQPLDDGLPTDLDRRELLSAEVLARLRADFVAGATSGSVYDSHTLNKTLGAAAACVQRAAWHAVPAQRGHALTPRRACGRQVSADSLSLSTASARIPRLRWRSRSCACRPARCVTWCAYGATPSEPSAEPFVRRSATSRRATWRTTPWSLTARRWRRTCCARYTS